MISKSNKNSQPINTKLILIVVVIVGLLILALDYISAKKDFAGILPRNTTPIFWKRYCIRKGQNKKSEFNSLFWYE